jgi:hypothetical protein
MCPRAPRESRFRDCQVVPPAAATSAAKSDVAFSMPSPSAKRAKRVILIGPADLALGSFRACPTLFLSSKMKGCSSRVCSLKKVFSPDSVILLDHRLGLALLAELVSQNVLLALDHGRINAGRIDRERVRRRDMHGDLPADRRELVGLAGLSSATSTPILPRPSDTWLCM